MTPASILQHYLDMLPASKQHKKAPMPEVVEANNRGSKWSGLTLFYYNSGRTVVKYQKAFAQDETTLRRILAHEACHVWAFWICCVVGECPRWDSEGHESGSAWARAAAIINQHEGAGFVTETSDMSYARTDSNPYYMLIKQLPGNRLGWAWFVRITPTLLKNLKYTLNWSLATGSPISIVVSKDQRWLHSKAKLPNLAIPEQDGQDALKEMMEINPITPEEITNFPQSLGDILGRANQPT